MLQATHQPGVRRGERGGFLMVMRSEVECRRRKHGEVQGGRHEDVGSTPVPT